MACWNEPMIANDIEDYTWSHSILQSYLENPLVKFKITPSAVVFFSLDSPNSNKFHFLFTREIKRQPLVIYFEYNFRNDLSSSCLTLGLNVDERLQYGSNNAWGLMQKRKLISPEQLCKTFREDGSPTLGFSELDHSKPCCCGWVWNCGWIFQ